MHTDISRKYWSFFLTLSISGGTLGSWPNIHRRMAAADRTWRGPNYPPRSRKCLEMAEKNRAMCDAAPYSL
jgi:hypothetical protein